MLRTYRVVLTIVYTVTQPAENKNSNCVWYWYFLSFQRLSGTDRSVAIRQLIVHLYLCFVMWCIQYRIYLSIYNPLREFHACGPNLRAWAKPSDTKNALHRRKEEVLFLCSVPNTTWNLIRLLLNSSCNVISVCDIQSNRLKSSALKETVSA
jgi:hypothetical protein